MFNEYIDNKIIFSPLQFSFCSHMFDSPNQSKRFQKMTGEPEWNCIALKKTEEAENPKKSRRMNRLICQPQKQKK